MKFDVNGKNMQGFMLWNTLYGLEWTHKYCVEHLTKYATYEEICKFMSSISEKDVIFGNQHIEKCDIEGCVSYFRKNKCKIRSLCKMNSKKITKENTVAPTVEKEDEIDYMNLNYTEDDFNCIF